ncbi:hypothetical protein BM536_034065 [Streptomyces phaeoluteigriseus]|uniref:Uncharacterized protein n=1 Tax=Streptomyces phaeoluteigriseus TaxID=114686 RepID=A0A1V6ML68_9ACTN|nr:hypothetical protein BM536_034065 [Streptomyces phaeoluteigriseus]
MIPRPLVTSRLPSALPLGVYAVRAGEWVQLGDLTPSFRPANLFELAMNAPVHLPVQEAMPSGVMSVSVLKIY